MGVKTSYSFIDKIITQGFLSLGLCFDGKTIVFKTLTEKEYRNLKFLCASGDSKLEKVYRLCLSTFMVDGVNMLVDRNSNLEKLKDFYESLPLIAINSILNETTKLNNRYLWCLKYFEGFCYTDKSRYLWKILNRGTPTSSSFSGIEGTENCGLNLVQENWVHINNRLDEEDSYDREFNLALMISSSMNPKGSRSVSITYKNNKEEMDDVRSQVAHYGYDKKRYLEERKPDQWSKPIKTKEDLVRELDKQIRGEKDQHDLFIEKWIIEQKRLAEAAKNSMMEKQQEYRKKLEDIDGTQIEGSRLATTEEIEQLDNRKRGHLVSVGEGAISYEKQQAFIKKVSSVILKGENKV